ncbi:MAG TPA: sigma-70 family RNA polymerase sigma factor, partial [Polyangiaceae bacterium]
PSRPLRPYLFGIALRVARAHRRKRSRELPLGAVEARDEKPGPEDALSTKQAYDLLQAALERIPPSRRAVLVMHELDQLPVDEIAQTLAIPLFTAYSRLRKARRELAIATRRLSSTAHARGRRSTPRPRAALADCSTRVSP